MYRVGNRGRQPAKASKRSPAGGLADHQVRKPWLGRSDRHDAQPGRHVPRPAAGGFARVERPEGRVRLLSRALARCAVHVDGRHDRCPGREHPWLDASAVFIFNHRNNMDVLMACKLVGRGFTSVGKKEAGESAVGRPGKLIGAVFIDRDDTQGSIESDAAGSGSRPQGPVLVISPRAPVGGAGSRPVQEGSVPHRDGCRRPDRADRVPQRRRDRLAQCPVHARHVGRDRPRPGPHRRPGRSRTFPVIAEVRNALRRHSPTGLTAG